MVKVGELFICSGIMLFICEMWVQLCDDVMCYGIYNQNFQVVLLIGFIFYINYVMLSIYLIVVKVEICKEGKIGCVYYFVLFMINENLVLYQDVYEIGVEKIIDIYVEVICYVDQGLLLTLFFFDIVIICDINKVQIYVWCKGIKMFYYICLCQMVLEGTEIEGCVFCVF